MAEKPPPPIPSGIAEPPSTAAPIPLPSRRPAGFSRPYVGPFAVDRTLRLAEGVAFWPYLEEPGDTCVASDAERGTITANLLDLPFMVPGQSDREHLPKLTGGILLCEVEQPVFVPGVLIDGWPVRTGG